MKTLFIISLFLSSFTSLSSAIAESAVPDFSVKISQILSQKNAKPSDTEKWLLKFIPPAHFHFNTDAPMKVTATEKATDNSTDARIAFSKAVAGLEEVGFVGADVRLKEGAKIQAEIYVCDDQKTMCVRKVLAFALTKNSDFTEFDQEAAPGAKAAPSETKSQTKKSVKSTKSAKDEHGFWMNDADSAIAESIRTGKPLLIDFYGIWCPPCNLYNETVFPKKEFTRSAKNWVLLKMDADNPASFALKSRFKIGGYPTLVAVKNAKLNDISSLAEIDRIVGYYPLHEFLNMLGDAYANREMTLDEKLAAQKNSYLKTLQELLSIKIEQEDFKSALALAKEGERITGDPSSDHPVDEHFFPLSILAIRANDHEDLLKEKSSGDLLKSIYENRAKESNETLLKFEDLLTSKSEQFTKTQIAWANDVLDTLALRTIPETLSVPGVELSIADIDSMRVDVAEALVKADAPETAQRKTAPNKGVQVTDPSIVAANARAAASYQKMITAFHLENSRGMNLEFAHYLWKSGDIAQAKTIFEKFIKRYPKEFTFYYAEAKMDLELKDLTNARLNAEKAAEFSYGDNKLRSVERLVRVLVAQGEKALAVKRGNETLGEIKPVSDALQVRTNHYIKALKKAVDDAEKGTS
jgi:thiol-disulfide isomerase/thioredoxin